MAIYLDVEIGSVGLTTSPVAMVYGESYPNFGQDISSVKTLKDDIVIDRASNGKPRIRSFYDYPLAEFSIVHTMTSADKQHLEDYYTYYRQKNFNFTWIMDGTVHNCMFAGYPTFSIIGGDFYTATVPLVEV